MQVKLRLLACMALISCVLSSNAQTLTTDYKDNPPTVVTKSKVDHVDNEIADNNVRKPLIIADEFEVKLSTQHPYQRSSAGLVFEKEFYSHNSSYIKLYITNFDLAEGDYVEVFSPNTGESHIYAQKGKIVNNNGDMISNFWTGIIMDEKVIVRMYTAGASTGHGFDIERVAYGFSDERVHEISETSQGRSICGGDEKEQVICYNGTEMYRKSEAVCRLVINGGGLCTGWLLGCEGNVMTNNHCIGSAGDAANTDFQFNYINTDCAGTTAATVDTVASTSTFEFTDASDDFTIVQLPVNPTGTYGYLSLSSTPVTVGERIYIPQHPGGRRKEIAVNTDTDPDPSGFARVATAGNQVGYNCDTEGGSSGSAVLRYADNLVISIHCHGGCPNSSFGTAIEMINTLNAQGLMPACGVDDPNPPSPEVNFVGASTSITEGTDCSYQDIDFTVRIAQGASQNADVSFAISGGTATNMQDFELLTTNVTFPAGSTADHTMTVRVYNDAIVESDEDIMVDLTVNANGGDANEGALSTATINILNDDFSADTAGTPIVLWSDDFESGSTAAWTVTDDSSGSATNWAVTNEAGFPDAGFFDSDESNTTQFAYVNDDDCNCTMDGERMMTPGIDLSGLTSAEVVFDYVFDNTYAGDIATLQLSTDGGTSWPAAATLASTSTGDVDNLPWVTVTIDLTAYVGQTVNLAAHFNDNGGWGQGFLIDNFRVQTPGHANVQTAMNAGTSANFTLNGMGTSFAYDAGSGDVMVGVQNNDSHDYGCTETSVTRSGTGGTTYNGSVAPELVADKTIYINPTSNTTTGNVTVTLYFTEAEIAGWEASTTGTYTRNDLYILRDDAGPITLAPDDDTILATEIQAATVVTDAANGIVTVSGTFSGLGGFVVGPQNALLSTPDFSLDNSNITLYPNPTTDNITINVPDSILPDTYEVYNMLGQRIISKEINSEADLTINAMPLRTGMYFVKVANQSSSVTLQFIKE